MRIGSDPLPARLWRPVRCGPPAVSAPGLLELVRAAGEASRFGTSRRFATIQLILLVGLLFAGATRAGQTIYQKPSAFIAEACGGKLPPTKAIRLSGTHQRRIKQLLGREYRPSTVRYWRAGSKLVVILDEIGKTEPITTGFVVTGGRLERVKVLIYRESHGSEVSRTSFTKQFRGAKLRSEGRLDKRVDGIAGATLSVRAVTKLAQVALYLDQVAPK